MEHVKIQINDGEALERLLGDSPELRLEFKNKVVDQLVKTHLYRIIDNNLLNEIQKEVHDTIESLKAKYLGSLLNTPVVSKFSTGLELNADTKKLITEQVNTIVSLEIAQHNRTQAKDLQARCDNMLAENRLRIQEYIQKSIDNMIAEQVTSRLSVIMTELVKVSEGYKAEVKRQEAAADINNHRKLVLEL